MKQYIVEITQYNDSSGRAKTVYYIGESEDHAWPTATNRENAKVFTNLHDMAAAIYDYGRAATAYGLGASYFHYRPSADRILVLEL